MSTALYTLDRLKAHQVYKNATGKRVPGVTTILGILDKPALLQWAWRMGQEGVDINKARDRAADIGTVSHARVEAHLRGMDFDETGLDKTALDLSANAFLAFLEWWERSGFAVEATELQMVSEAWQVGGTLDILARRGDARALVDIKTSNGVYREHRLQVCAYARMWEEAHGGQDISEVWIVRIPKDESGVCEPIEIINRPLYVEAFSNLCKTYRALQALPR
jgi:hypothetical protein